MPDGFGFPYDHQFWLPFRANPLAYERFDGPTIYVFGRLAPGVSMEQAQAELTAKQPAPAPDRSDPREPLRAAVVPYTHDHVDLASPGMVWLFRIGQLLTGALVFVVAVNLAILFYARTVTRLGEIAVRTALGASRRRILAQLFVEALALSLLGAASGLGLTSFFGGRVPLPNGGAGIHDRSPGRVAAYRSGSVSSSLRPPRSRHWCWRSSPPSSWACCPVSKRPAAT